MRQPGPAGLAPPRPAARPGPRRAAGPGTGPGTLPQTGRGAGPATGTGLRTLGWIAVTSGRLWVRDTTRSLGISPRVLALLGGLAFAVLAGGSLLLASVLPALPDDVAPEALAQTRELSAALLWTVAGLVTTVLLLFAPRRTALSDVLTLLPVSRTVTAVAGQLPVLAVAVLVVAPLSAPTVVMLAEASRGGLGFVIPAALLLAAGLMPAVTLLFQAVVPALQRLRVPPHHALVGGGVAGMAASVTPPALELGGARVGWLPHHALAAGAEGSPAALTLLVLWSAAGVAVFTLVVGRLPRDPSAAPSRLLARFGVPPGRPAALAWYELVSLVRAPQYAAVVVFTAVVLGALLAGWWATGSAFLPLLAAPALLPFFFASLQSYGHTRGTHWLGAHLLARPAPWVVPKALVCLGLAIVLAAPAAALAAAAGLLAWADLPLLLVQAVPAWAAAMLAGLVLPYSTEQPLSVGLSVGLAGLCYAGGLWGIGRLLPDAPPLASLLGLTCLLAAGYLLVAATTRPELRHV